jgi:hypothetical protein
MPFEGQRIALVAALTRRCGVWTTAASHRLLGKVERAVRNSRTRRSRVAVTFALLPALTGVMKIADW